MTVRAMVAGWLLLILLASFSALIGLAMYLAWPMFVLLTRRARMLIARGLYRAALVVLLLGEAIDYRRDTERQDTL